MNHGERLNDKMTREAFIERFGATGLHPNGKINNMDQGELRFGVSHDPSDGIVLLNFGKPVSWIGMSAIQAEELSKSLYKHARDCRVIKSENETKVEAKKHGKES